MGMPACVCARLFVFVSMGWKIEFGPCHGKKGARGAGRCGCWVVVQHQRPKMKADNFASFRVDERGDV